MFYILNQSLTKMGKKRLANLMHQKQPANLLKRTLDVY